MQLRSFKGPAFRTDVAEWRENALMAKVLRSSHFAHIYICATIGNCMECSEASRCGGSRVFWEAEKIPGRLTYLSQPILLPFPLYVVQHKCKRTNGVLAASTSVKTSNKLPQPHKSSLVSANLISFTMSTMLRPLLRSSRRSVYRLKNSVGCCNARFAFSTQSGDDAKKPTALAKIHLEDGTTLTGRSFGCHTSVEGEVSAI